MEVAPTLGEGSRERVVPGCLGPAGFKWCSAHIYIARKIRQDQEQDRGRKVGICEFTYGSCACAVRDGYSC